MSQTTIAKIIDSLVRKGLNIILHFFKFILHKSFMGSTIVDVSIWLIESGFDKHVNKFIGIDQ